MNSFMNLRLKVALFVHVMRVFSAILQAGRNLNQ